MGAIIRQTLGASDGLTFTRGLQGVSRYIPPDQILKAAGALKEFFTNNDFGFHTKFFCYF